MSQHSLAREFNRSDISKVAPINGQPPENDMYQRQLAAGFQLWHLIVDGLVARRLLLSRGPETLSFAQSDHPSTPAKKAGLSLPMDRRPSLLCFACSGVSPQEKYVVFFPFDDLWDSLDMPDAWHPQTLLAYGMNGHELPSPHGAPIRLRVARQLGYKSIKYLSRITVTNTLKNIGQGSAPKAPN